MNIKRLILILTAAVFLLVPSWAAAGTSIQVKPGINGLYKNHKPVQLNITVYNTGQVVKDALLRVTADKGKAGTPNSRAVYQRVIDLPAEGKIETYIIIPGELAAQQPEVQLIAGGRMLDSAVVQGMAVQDDFVVVSVGEKPLANGLPAWLENSSGYNTVKYLPPADLPHNPIALGAADVIIIDKEKASHIQPDQAKAVRQWVALGGNLILSGGAAAAEGEHFASISPVITEGYTSLGGNWNGMRTESSPIPIADGKFVSGEKLLTVESYPIIARNRYGKGNVIYSAAGLENFNAGDQKIWELLFNKYKTGYHVNYKIDVRHFYPGGASIPGLKMPSVKLMALIWTVYMLGVSLGLYLLLKRYQKRDWAWFCIPAAALLTTGIIYSIAPFHRMSGPLGHHEAVIKLLDGGIAEIEGNSSIVSHRGGTYQIADSGVGLIYPRVGYRGNGRWEKVVVQYNGGSQNAYFHDVEFWSMRNAGYYKVEENFGALDGEIKLSNQTASVMLQNNTGMDLVDCITVIGDRAINIGRLEAGEKITKKIKLKNAENLNWQNEVNNWFKDLESDRDKWSPSRTVRVVNNRYNKTLTAQVIAYTDNVPSFIKLTGSSAQNYYKALVMQELPVEYPSSGKLVLPPGFILPVAVDGGGIEITPEGSVLHGVRVTLDYNLNLPVDKLEITKVKIDQITSAAVNVKIYNWSKGQWVDYTDFNDPLTGEKLQHYLSHNKVLRLKIIRSLEKPDITPIPKLAVEGVIK